MERCSVYLSVILVSSWVPMWLTLFPSLLHRSFGSGVAAVTRPFSLSKMAKAGLLRKDSALLFHKSERVRASCALSTIKKVQDRELDMYLEKHGFTDMNSPIEVGPVQDKLLPIHVATLHAEDEAVRMLLTAGADPEAETFGGRSALDIAQHANIGRSHLQVLQLLRGAVRIVEVTI